MSKAAFKMLSISERLSIGVFCGLILAMLPTISAVGEQPANPRERVTIPLNPLPFDLGGYLRRPDNSGPFPAVIILPACGVFMNSVDQGWGETLASWGYVALTLDIFTSRGIEGVKTCLHPAHPDATDDVRRGWDWLAARKYVDRNRIFLIGFGRGGSVVLSAVERTAESKTKHSFRGAAAFNPACKSEKGVMTVSTLVVVGALDAMEVDACRKMAQGENEIGLSRQKSDGVSIQFIALPNAYSGFDLPTFKKPVDVRGLHLEFSQSATEQSKTLLREFLQSLQ